MAKCRCGEMGAMSEVYEARIPRYRGVNIPVYGMVSRSEYNSKLRYTKVLVYIVWRLVFEQQNNGYTF